MLATLHHGDSRIFLEDAPLAVVPVLLVAGFACWSYVGLQLEPWLAAPRVSTPGVTATQGASVRERLRLELGRFARPSAPSQVANSNLETAAAAGIVAAGAGGNGSPAPSHDDERCVPALEFRFEPGGNDPARVAADELRAFLDHARAHPERKVVVEGYASQDGNPELNLRLSHARANAAARVLQTHDIAQTRVILQAFGEYRPSIDGADDRRAVARIDGAPRCEGASIP